jgi:hypothetical protein
MSQQTFDDGPGPTADEKVFGPTSQPDEGYYSASPETGSEPTEHGRVRRVGSVIREAARNSVVVARANSYVRGALLTFLLYAGMVSFGILNVVLYKLEGLHYVGSVVLQTIYLPLVVVVAEVVLFVFSSRINKRYNGDASHIINGVTFVLMAAGLVFSLKYLTDIRWSWPSSVRQP